jgi:colanic acid/amylovoran biosynthesis glycosyltransferase
MPPEAGTAKRTSVVYVTAQLPYGANEPFIVPEIAELERQGCDVTVVPVRPKGQVVHGDAQELLAQAVVVPLLSGAVLRSALAEATRSPSAVARALLSMRRSRNGRTLLKNLAVFPKALWLAALARRVGAGHLHAHWAGTSGTLAMVAGEISGVPWSLTTHRWDIAEDNLLGLKARSACFARAISSRGAEELRGIVADPDWAPWLLHVGVHVPPPSETAQAAEPPLRVLTAASLLELKGHRYLIDAVGRLRERSIPVRAELAGEGPLAPSLRQQVSELGLEQEVVFLGNVPHEKLLGDMSAGRWHAAVLPSVVTAEGAQEGIPVSLLEAMARGLPAIGTDSGAIPELLGDGAGLLVAAADSDALARALESLAGDPDRRAALAERGRRRVAEAFSVEQIAAALHSRFCECAGREGTEGA